MDQDALWEVILVDGWGVHVRDAVVARVEHRCAGRRGLLTRVVADPDNARFAWTEWLHSEVMVAISVETGADLEGLGSQAAWACYEDVWSELTRRWRTGARLARVAPEDGDRVRSLLADLPAWVAELGGADIGEIPAVPLEVDGDLRLDVDGLLTCLHERRHELDEPTCTAVTELVTYAR